MLLAGQLVTPWSWKSRHHFWALLVSSSNDIEIFHCTYRDVGWCTFFLFGALNFAAIPIVWALYPETANKSLEEIDVLFSTKSLLVWNAEKELRAKGIDPDHPLAHLAEKSDMDEKKQQVA